MDQVAIHGVGLVVFGCLLAFSLVSWSIIFRKAPYFLKLRKQIQIQDELLQYCQTHPWGKWHEKMVALDETYYFSKIYHALLSEFKQVPLEEYHVKSRLQKQAELVLEEYEEQAQSGLSWLATIATVSPYVGLLGTIWGVMQAFASIGQHQGGMNQLAPGMSEALIATAAGLLVAIPSSIFFNKYNAAFRGLLQKMSRQGEYLLLYVDNNITGE